MEFEGICPKSIQRVDAKRFHTMCGSMIQMKSKRGGVSQMLYNFRKNRLG